jgi:ferredoxin/predicted CopG family antitoxin
MSGEERRIPISEKAYERLTFARRDEESFSDVIIRLSSSTLEALQRRGEKEIVTSEGRKLTVSIDQGVCLGAMSCVALAPSLFAIDVTQLGVLRKHDEPLGMKDVLEGEIDSESLVLAAESCPYKAIRIKDTESGAGIVP